MSESEPWVTLRLAAKHFTIGHDLLYRLMREGRLAWLPLSEKRGRRVRLSDVEAALRSRGGAVEENQSPNRL